MRWFLVGLLVLTGGGCGGDDDDAGAVDAAASDGGVFKDAASPDSGPDAAVTLMFNVAGHDYGSIQPGGATGFMYIVRNVSATTTGAMMVVISGDDASEFGFGFNGCNGMTLAPQATCNMAVRFSPASGGSPGPRVAALRASYQGGSDVAQIPITGTVIPAPLLMVSPANVLFPDTAAGNTSAASDLVLRNSSTTATLTSLAMSSAGAAAAFPAVTVANGCTVGQSLAPQATCNLRYTFKCTAAGLNMVTLFFSATGPAGTVNASAVLTGTCL